VLAHSNWQKAAALHRIGSNLEPQAVSRLAFRCERRKRKKRSTAFLSYVACDSLVSLGACAEPATRIPRQWELASEAEQIVSVIRLAPPPSHVVSQASVSSQFTAKPLKTTGAWTLHTP